MNADLPRPYLSVVVKCFNEEGKLDACLRSLIDATSGMNTEIIVVDSLSTDRSVDVAARHPVRIVQLCERSDQRCGAVAQLGYQVAQGRYLLLVDGDMEVMPEFLPAALAALEGDPRLAGVGGRLIEMSDGMEFRERQLRLKGQQPIGEVKRITGCALYKAEPIRALGYFMDRNLHCFEEFELGLRLRTQGWRLQMLDLACVRHYGHRDASLKLLVRRWRTRFFHGYGELLRSAWRRPYAFEAAAACRVALLVLAWWTVLAGLLVGAIFVPWLVVLLAVAMVMPWAALVGRKASLSRASHSFLVWQFSAASLVAGLLAHRHEPTQAIGALMLKEPAVR